VLRVAGVPAAALISDDEFVESDDAGYVGVVGVLPEYRGRGLAALLLRRCFAEDAARGRVATFLHVDSNNTTPAVELYRRIGMREVLSVEAWQGTFPVDAVPRPTEPEPAAAGAATAGTGSGRSPESG
jgi:mycothiol synthase